MLDLGMIIWRTLQNIKYLIIEHLALKNNFL